MAAPKKSRRGLLAAGAAIVAIAIAAWGIYERESNVSALAVTANNEAVPTVSVITPTAGPKTRTLTLPGDVSAWYQAPIYAQVSGYVQMWYKDYGAQVKRGDVLATIDTPDLDQELLGAQAQLEVAKAKYQLAVVTANRWKSLAGTQAVSQQQVDVQVANAKEAKSEVDAAQANVSRYQAQESFKKLVAPFDGIVTARGTDVGSYVTAAGASASNKGATSLFSVADLHQMRIFVSVPQDYSSSLRPGVTATVTFPQFPDQTINASFATTANSINTQSRTVLTELIVDNPDHKLWPGAYAEVHLKVPTRPGILVIPEQALLFRAAGMQVALVGADNKVHLQSVKLGLNLDTKVQITSGLKATDRLIANPSDGLLEGQQVRIVKVPAQNANNDGENSKPAQ